MQFCSLYISHQRCQTSPLPVSEERSSYQHSYTETGSDVNFEHMFYKPMHYRNQLDKRDRKRISNVSFYTFILIIQTRIYLYMVLLLVCYLIYCKASPTEFKFSIIARRIIPRSQCANYAYSAQPKCLCHLAIYILPAIQTHKFVLCL